MAYTNLNLAGFQGVAFTHRVDQVGGNNVQLVKVLFGGEGVLNEVTAGTPLPITGALTDAQLRATAVPVSGPLTDTQLRAAAVPVSGPLTDAQLRASAVPVTGPLTDAQLRATAVPVSGPLTDTQLRATPVPVRSEGVAYTGGSFTITTGGTAQQAFAANTARRVLIVQNTDDNEGLAVTLTAAETPSATVGIVLGPGQGIHLQNPAPTGLIRVWGATTGNRFVAYEA